MSPKAYFLVGAPGSGKTTFYDDILGFDTDLISSDWHIEDMCDDANMTYNQGFTKFIKKAEAEMMKDFETCLAYNVSFAIDRTNMSVKSRKRFLDKISKDYTKIAIVFDCPDEELQSRLDHREKTEGKRIDWSIVEGMKGRYEEPTEEEGFDYIMKVMA